MANLIPDDFEQPQEHDAPKKSFVENVMNQLVKGTLGIANGAISLMAGLLAAVLVLYSGYVIYDTVSIEMRARASAWDLLDYKPSIIEDNMTPLAGASELSKINEDYRAWLTINETYIDYPVVQGPDDLFYAWHDIYRNSSLTGAIYLSINNSGDFSDSYNLVYGHHMERTGNGSMFGALDLFLNPDYFDAHTTGIVVSKSGVYDIELFAVARTDAYEGSVYNGNTAAGIITFLRNHYNTATTDGTTTVIFKDSVASSASQVIALSTCADATTNGRLVVFGKMTKRDLIMITPIGYNAVYDGQEHAVTFFQDGTFVTADTTIEYSTDNGANWSATVPTIKDVGTKEVMVRAYSPVNGQAEGTVTLTVTPKAVTVKANSAAKTYGTADPIFSATVTGLVNGDTINYTVAKTGAGDTVGFYSNAIVASGLASQGNYVVTYETGNFTINPSSGLTLTVNSYDGTYDGQPHSVSASVNVPEGTTIEYSTDGGNTWSTTPPSYTGPGTLNFIVRATNPNYVTVTASGSVHIEEQTVSATIRKQWVGDTEADRPDEVRVVLTGGTTAQTVTLTAANGWTQTIDDLPAGVTYTWSEPEVLGYRQTSRTTADGVTTLVNTKIETPVVEPTSYDLTISYRFVSGGEAAPAYTAQLTEGERYNVTSPTVAGYTAVPAQVSGVMNARATEITVLYVPTSLAPTDGTTSGGTKVDDSTIVIEDFETPLGLGEVFINLGDCFE